MVNKPDRRMNNSSQSRNLVLLVATMLPAVVLAASPLVSYGPTAAFALETDKKSIETEANVQNQGDGITVAPIVQVPVQVGPNVDVDDDIVVDTCDDGSVTAVDNKPDTQQNLQTINQGANVNNDVGQFGTAASPVVQVGVEVGINVNVDKDVIVGLDCHGQDITVADDDSAQTNYQSIDEEGKVDNKVAPGNAAVNAIEQIVTGVGQNLNNDVDTTIIQ